MYTLTVRFRSFPLMLRRAVNDLRDIESERQPTLDANGFTWIKSPSGLAYKDFESDEVIRERYYPEVAAMLRNQTGATGARYAEIVVLDHEVRCSCHGSRHAN
jgi:hypothetical protein